MHSAPDTVTSSLVEQLNGRSFVTTGNDHGLSTSATTFNYFVNGTTVTGHYSGGEIAAGQILGKATAPNTIELLFQCLTADGRLMGGQSSGQIGRDHTGLLTLDFDWSWLTDDRSGGTSHYIEIAGDDRTGLN